jgi:hypothetical protein
MDSVVLGFVLCFELGMNDEMWDGKDVGATLGLKVGDALDIGDGFIEKDTDGEALGFTDGRLELGMNDGIKDGTAVGAKVGSKVGVKICSKVGDTLGKDDGLIDGAMDGETRRDGITLGRHVGTVDSVVVDKVVEPNVGNILDILVGLIEGFNNG